MEVPVNSKIRFLSPGKFCQVAASNKLFPAMLAMDLSSSLGTVAASKSRFGWLYSAMTGTSTDFR
jgi:hypothetical protein